LVKELFSRASVEMTTLGAGSWGELHLVFFRGFDARNYAPIWIPLQLSTFRAFKPFDSDILPFKDTKGEPTLEFQHTLRVQQ
jgi:hypothetical protein